MRWLVGVVVVVALAAGGVALALSLTGDGPPEPTAPEASTVTTSAGDEPPKDPEDPVPTPPGQLTVTNRVRPAGDPTRFTFTGLVEARLADGNEAYADVPAGVTGTVAVTVPDGWSLLGVDCDGGRPSSDTVVGRLDISLEPDERVRCDFEMARHGSVTIATVVVPEAEAAEFEYTGAVEAILSHGQASAVDVPAGEVYSIRTPARERWQLTDVDCDDGSPASAAKRLAEVEIGPGEEVTCSFTHTSRDVVTALYLADLAAAVRPQALEDAMTGFRELDGPFEDLLRDWPEARDAVTAVLQDAGRAAYVEALFELQARDTAPQSHVVQSLTGALSATLSSAQPPVRLAELHSRLVSHADRIHGAAAHLHLEASRERERVEDTEDGPGLESWEVERRLERRRAVLDLEIGMFELKVALHDLCEVAAQDLDHSCPAELRHADPMAVFELELAVAETWAEDLLDMTRTLTDAWKAVERLDLANKQELRGRISDEGLFQDVAARAQGLRVIWTAIDLPAEVEEPPGVVDTIDLVGAAGGDLDGAFRKGKDIEVILEHADGLIVGLEDVALGVDTMCAAPDVVRVEDGACYEKPPPQA